jgi:Holliday junction resolvasome RuvABC endonuclease subunit
MILGIDLSLNHSGFVALDDDGGMVWWHFVSDAPKHCLGLLPDNAAPMPFTKAKGKKEAVDREATNARRLAWWSKHLAWVMQIEPGFVGIEDYAISAQSNSAYQIGEIGGIARLAALSAGARLRLHDPMTVKMFGAHLGNAEPEAVAAAVRYRWPETHVWDALADLPRIDLACAYVVARMVLVETKLRSGSLQLKDLEHEKEIAVFQRATSSNPISLLGRDWIML